MPTLDEQLLSDEEARRQEFEQLQQEERRSKRAKRAQRVANTLGSTGNDGTEQGRQVTGNSAGNRAGEFAQKKFGASTGQAAAVGGAVSGALQGEGATGIAKSAAAWWWLNIVFGALIIEEITLVGILLAIISVAYLDFHFIMSKIKKGRGFFVSLNLWQKIVLAISNVIVLIVPMIFVAIFGAYMQGCGFAPVDFATKWNRIVNLGLVSDPCATTPGSLSGGGGASGGFGLSIVVTSAYRPDSAGSAHQRGEAVDIALRPQPTSNSDPRIKKLFDIAKSAGLVPPQGDTIDEWNNPQEKTSAGHIHIEFNLKSKGNLSSGSYCDNDGPIVLPPKDLVSLSDYGIPFTGIVAPNQPKVRPCIIDEIQEIFNAAALGS